jgi:hypothetical protein
MNSDSSGVSETVQGPGRFDHEGSSHRTGAMSKADIASPAALPDIEVAALGSKACLSRHTAAMMPLASGEHSAETIVAIGKAANPFELVLEPSAAFHPRGDNPGRIGP